MRFSIVAPFVVLGAALQAFAQSDASQAAALLEGLMKAPTQAARINVLNSAKDWVFDFNAGVGTTRNAGGNLTVANVANFPALFDNGIAMALGQLAPCGMNTPHTHPRATEVLFLIDDGPLEIGFIQENQTPFIKNTLYPGQGTVFPMGSIHFQVNLSCKPATFFAALNSEDPGASQVAQRFFGLGEDVVNATLGDVGIEEVVFTSIPDNLALGIDTCLKQCGIERVGQTTTQLQPPPIY